MRDSQKVLLTIGIEALLFLIISFIFKWKFLDTAFFGGITIFGGIWLISFYVHQENVVDRAMQRGMTGQDVGEIKPYKYNMTPVNLGLLIFALAGFCFILIGYAPYFLD
ncbi:hypothetical protein [Radiobacillus deserti]|uniref:DUF3899 domain-containing protein n=1 Tax=Radiobacillus deserti TaxID=2594883 RepID=A0A516KCY5_9BACI|nr:hypothetical protein [Radiobacillus deserti]QDP39217.1 hypothetical protein FN924_02805 [Radiobacillus deserti]